MNMRLFKKNAFKGGIIFWLITAPLFIISANFIFALKVIKGQEASLSSFDEAEKSLRKGHGFPATGNNGSLDDARKNIAVFKKRFTNQQGLTRVIDRVFDSARRNGLSISAGEYSPETIKETGVYKYSISFPVEGRYSQIKKFIYGIETMKYPVVIEGINLSGSKGAEGTINLKIRISTYFL